MSSLVIYSNEFDGQLNNGLAPEKFKYRFLVEGDSWMDRSAMFHTSLLQQLAHEYDLRHESALFINLAIFGDTMRKIGEQAGREFAKWLNTDFNWRFDAILLSAGGNDFIDAARDPDPGQGILRNMVNQPIPQHGFDCADASALAKLVNDWLDPNFTRVLEVVRSSRYHASTPIFLNNYDTPVARNAPAFEGGKAWLYEAYRKNSIDPSLWPDLTDGVFNELQFTIAGWAKGSDSVFVVPTDGTLTPAEAGSTGDDGDWLNEIHPNESGWKKLAAVWHSTISKNIT